MHIVIDIILVVIIGLCAFIGYKRGFINQIIDLLSGIIAFFTAYFVTPLVAPFISERLFYSGISSHISDVLNGILNGTGASELFGDGQANENFRNFLSKFGADYDSIKEGFMTKAAESSEDAVAGITDKVASPVSYAVAYALCFILIFILALIILWIIKRLLNLAAKLPVLSHANKILGVVAGVIIGILIVWLLSIILKLCLPCLHAAAPSVFPEDLFERSYVLRLVYYLNVLRAMIDFSYIKKLVGA